MYCPVNVITQPIFVRNVAIDPDNDVFNFPIVNPDAEEIFDPGYESWCFPPLRKAKKGSDKEMFWQIGYSNGQMVTISGTSGGKIKISEPTFITVKGKNSLGMQAYSQMRNLYRTRVRKGSHLLGQELSSTYVNPMLAREFTPGTALSYPVAVQPKLDGIRVYVKIIDGQLIPMTRQNKSLEHAMKYIIPSLRYLLQVLPNAIGFDGELYLHQLPDQSYPSFNQIQSIVTTKISEHLQLPLISFHIFDVDIPHFSFQDRFTALNNAIQTIRNGLLANPSYNPGLVEFNYYVPLVETLLVYSEADINTHHDRWVEQGYEGVMIRLLDRAYENGRSSAIYKYKYFNEGEGVIVDVVSGNGADLNAAIFVITFNGIQFSARPSGTRDQSATIEERRRIFTLKDYYRGTLVEFRYQNLTPEGIPRFPRVIKWNRFD